MRSASTLSELGPLPDGLEPQDHRRLEEVRVQLAKEWSRLLADQEEFLGRCSSVEGDEAAAQCAADQALLESEAIALGRRIKVHACEVGCALLVGRMARHRRAIEVQQRRIRQLGLAGLALDVEWWVRRLEQSREQARRKALEGIVEWVFIRGGWGAQRLEQAGQAERKRFVETVSSRLGPTHPATMAVQGIKSAKEQAPIFHEWASQQKGRLLFMDKLQDDEALEVVAAALAMLLNSPSLKQVVPIAELLAANFDAYSARTLAPQELEALSGLTEAMVAELRDATTAIHREVHGLKAAEAELANRKPCSG